MAPRRRIQGREEWPEGLHKRTMRGEDRYYFTNENGKDTYFPPGTTFFDAYQAAKAYNDKYRSPAIKFATSVDPYNKPLSEWSKIILQRVKDEEELGENAMDTFEHDVKRVDSLLGHILSKEITAKHVTEYLNHYCVEPGKSKNVYNRKLSFLNKYFNYLNDEQGLTEHPSKSKKFKVFKRAEKVKQRLNLDKEAYLAIYEAAPTWLKVAMGICLQSTHAVKELHRLRLRIKYPREGVCGCVWFNEPKKQLCQLTNTEVNVYGTMYIHRHKVQHSKTSFVAIPITDELKYYIDLAKTDRLACPFVVRKKHKTRASIPRQCEHLFQLQSTGISKEFSKVRDSLGLYDDIPVNKRPTFHEIRRLSAQALHGYGVDPMKRMAHADEKSTRIYTDRNNVEWVEVDPVAVKIEHI